MHAHPDASKATAPDAVSIPVAAETARQQCHREALAAARIFATALRLVPPGGDQTGERVPGWQAVLVVSLAAVIEPLSQQVLVAEVFRGAGGHHAGPIRPLGCQSTPPSIIHLRMPGHSARIFSSSIGSTVGGLLVNGAVLNRRRMSQGLSCSVLAHLVQLL